MNIISLEGLNGVGKTTLFNRIQLECIINHITYVEFMKFPSTSMKEHIINYEKYKTDKDFLDLSFMCIDDFHDYFTQKKKYLAKHRNININDITFIFDRYIFSTLFYHFAHKKDINELNTLCKYFHQLQLYSPNLIIWIDSTLDKKYLSKRYPSIDLESIYKENFTIIKEIYDKNFPKTEWLFFYNEKNIKSAEEFLKLIKKI